MELTPLDCPACGHTNSPFGVINVEQQYRCASCGMVYYGPAECADETDEAAAGDGTDGLTASEAGGQPVDDWQVQPPTTAD